MEFLVIALNFIATVVLGAACLVAGLLFLRVLLNWVGVNPFGRINYNLTRVTEPVIRPIRSQFGGRHMRYDLVPLVIGVLVLFAGYFLSSMISQFAAIFDAIANNIRYGSFMSRALAGELIRLASLLYIVAIFLRFFLPMFGARYSNRLMRACFQLTEPLLKPLRRLFVSSTFDFSPLVAILIVYIVTGVLLELVK